MARQKPARPFYEVFLERVIKIEAVQRYRAVVTDEDTAQFFEEGRRPGAYGDFHWSLDAPKVGAVSLIARSTDERPAPMSPAMEKTWDAAVTAWRKFIGELANGEMIAEGMNPISGIRTEMGPFEWSRTDLVLDVRNGDLIEGFYGRPIGMHTVRWSAIVLPAAIQEQKLGRVDWDTEWNEDVARREQGQLPTEKGYLPLLETRIKERYGVTNVDGGDLRRFKAALYRGDLARPRKR
jgi:hypothetical protein